MVKKRSSISTQLLSSNTVLFSIISLPQLYGYTIAHTEDVCQEKDRKTLTQFYI